MAVVNVAVDVPMLFTDIDGIGRAGLTVAGSARLAGSGTTVAATSVTDRGSGHYDARFTFASVGTWFVTGATTIDGDPVTYPTNIQVKTAAQDDPAASVTALYGTAFANLDAAVSSRATTAGVAAALSGTDVTVSSPVATDLLLTITRGNDYLNADASALSWVIASPSLVGATATLRIFTYAGTTVLSKAMTIASTTVRADATSSETAAFSLGTPAYKYTIKATLSGGSIRTLVEGTVWVVD